MSLLKGTSRDEADFYLLEFELPDLQPGRYRLEIRAENPETDAVRSTQPRARSPFDNPAVSYLRTTRIVLIS